MLRAALRRKSWEIPRDKPTSLSPSTASASLLKDRFAIRAQDRLHRSEPDLHASGIPDFSEAIYSTSPAAPVQVEIDIPRVVLILAAVWPVMEEVPTEKK
jgi:hypothetical protein